MSDLRKMVFKELSTHELTGHEAITRMVVSAEANSFVVSLSIGNGYRVVVPTRTVNAFNSFGGHSFYISGNVNQAHARESVVSVLDAGYRALLGALRRDGEDLDRGIPNYPIGRVKQRYDDKIVLEDPNDSVNFFVGVFIACSAWDGSEPSHALRSGVMLVKGIDYEKGEILLTEPPPENMTINDYLFSTLD